jgi:hypothetical protein
MACHRQQLIMRVVSLVIQVSKIKEINKAFHGIKVLLVLCNICYWLILKFNRIFSFIAVSTPMSVASVHPIEMHNRDHR